MKFVFGLLCCVAIAASQGYIPTVRSTARQGYIPTVRSTSYSQQFEEFKAKHNKVYRNEVENSHRLMVFVDNVEFIDAHNKEAAEGKHTFTLAVNKYADLTNEEFNARNNLKVRDLEEPSIIVKTDADADRPDSIDWTDEGYVNTPQDQGSCGSCWTFSSTGSMEGAIYKSTGVLYDLSKQCLVDCEPDSYGCEGGYIDSAFEYGRDEGDNLEKKYAYTSGDYDSDTDDQKGTCSKSGKEIFIDSYETPISKYDEEALANYLATVGPISIAIDASTRSFSYYSSGVHYNSGCGYKPKDLNHAVLAVGYGTDSDDGDYFIVKNSWGTDWGDDGFIKMARNQDNNCGVATDCAYAVA